MSQNTTASSICVSDSGADSCIIDDARAIEYTYGPKVNIVGFDSNVARKKNYSIVRAVTAVTDENGHDIIIRVHYGVHNEGSNTTLLSEHQLRDRKSPGVLGTQSLCLADDETVIPFTIRSALSTFEHRYPTETELSQLPQYDITADTVSYTHLTLPTKA